MHSDNWQYYGLVDPLFHRAITALITTTPDGAVQQYTAYLGWRSEPKLANELASDNPPSPCH